MQVLHIAGARPNFMKVAPLVRAFRARGVEADVCHTGQHYDERMSRLFFDELGLPEPFVNLGVGSGSHAQQTADVMKRFEPVVLERRPDLIVVVGDVNSTLACAIVGTKLRVPVAHVEAGLRSHDRDMPEELNRRVADAVSDLLYCSEPAGVANLEAEGAHPDRVRLVGNVMIDTLVAHRERARETGAREQLAPADEYAVVTLHRPSNVDDPAVADGLVGALERVAAMVPVVFPLHPRTAAALRAHGLLTRLEGRDDIVTTPPLGYLQFLDLLSGARLVLTDSGGIQEETTVLAIPCLTLRRNTERPVTVTHGTNRVVGTDPDTIVEAARAALAADTSGTSAGGRASAGSGPELWDGCAAERIVDDVAGGGLERVAALRRRGSEQISEG